MQGGNGDAQGEVTIQTHCLVHQQHTMPVKTEIPAVLPSVTSLVWGSETLPPLRSLVSEGYFFSPACRPKQLVHVRQEHFRVHD